MNISDLVPLIIIVGSIAYSIIKNTNKEKQEETAKTNLPGRKEIRIPQDVFSGQPKKEVDVKKEPVREFGEQIVDEKGEKIKSITHSVRIPNKKTKSTSEVLIEGDEESSLPLFSADNTDDLKKAIIYTEIFNRKEF